MTWLSAQLADKPVDVFEPEGDEPQQGVVVFLHGYDGVTLRDNRNYTEKLQQHRLACLCPIGPECWWSDRVFNRFDPGISPIAFLARHIPEFCQERWQVGVDRIGVMGVEMGGQGALQLAYRNARRFSVVVAISPKVDFESWYGHGTSLDEMFPDREAARQATATLHIHPLDWPRRQLLLCDPADFYCIDGVHTLASKLSSTGIPFDSDFETSRGGFGWDYANYMSSKAIDYLAQHLK